MRGKGGLGFKGAPSSDLPPSHWAPPSTGPHPSGDVVWKLNLQQLGLWGTLEIQSAALGEEVEVRSAVCLSSYPPCDLG